jgi:hypothetical protein
VPGPGRILRVGDTPRTKSGKIVELAVRNFVHGQSVKNVEALANPEALKHYRDRTESCGSTLPLYRSQLALCFDGEILAPGSPEEH